MSKKDYYTVSKNVNMLLSGKPTNFLDGKMLKEVISNLGKKCTMYKPYSDSEKNILYINEKPNVKLIEIKSSAPLTHREIMGSIYNLDINSDMFGDIVIKDDRYFVYILDRAYSMLVNEFKAVGMNPVELSEVNIDTLSDYKRQYEELTLIVSSLRTDTIVSKITNTSREGTKDLFINGNVILNYEECNKIHHNIAEGDIFSIRKYGKYKYIGVERTNKKGNFVIKLLKYIDN